MHIARPPGGTPQWQAPPGAPGRESPIIPAWGIALLGCVPCNCGYLLMSSAWGPDGTAVPSQVQGFALDGHAADSVRAQL